MKKYVVITVAFIAALCVNTLTAQKITKPAARASVAKPKPIPAKLQAEEEPPIADTFAYNLATAVHLVCVFAADDRKPAYSLTNGYKESNSIGSPVFKSKISMPGALENTVTRISVDRQKGDTWVWTAVMFRKDKFTTPETEIYALKKRIENIIKTIPPLKGGADRIESIKAEDNISNAQFRYLYKQDEVTVTVQFIKANLQTEQQAIDSLIKIYRPGMLDIETTNDASRKFSNALYAENLPVEKIYEVFSKQVRVMADKDIKIAYISIMESTRLTKPLALLGELTPEQKSKIQEIAAAGAEAFKNNGSFDVKTYTPTAPPPTVPLIIPPYDPSESLLVTQRAHRSAPQPEGRRVKCDRCGGSGQCEIIDAGHTYLGIYYTGTTTITHWGTCPKCNGEGWVTVYKKN